MYNMKYNKTDQIMCHLALGIIVVALILLLIFAPRN